MTRGNLSLVIPMLALLVLGLGVINEPKNAYAGFEEEVDICHFPPGNPSEYHTVDDFPSGHIGNHEFDYLGECDEEEGEHPSLTDLHGQVTEVHCEVHYYWELEFLEDGFREGYGECVYIFEDEFELEVEVYVEGGDFEISFGEDGIIIEGEFHIEDEEDNIIWITEEGIITLGGCETEDSEETFIPYCLETTGTVDEGEGIFDGLTGEVERHADGYITHFDFPEYLEGFAYSTIWIFFDIEGETEPEEEETKKSGGSCSNCQQPSIGVTDKGKRVVDGGITVNGHTIDADFYHTAYPLIQAKIGTPIDFVFKIWDDRADNIKHVQVQLGKNKVGESFNQVGSITWDRNVMTKIATVTHDPMFKNVHVERHIDQDCKVGGTPCTIIHVRFTPTVAIVGDVVFGVNIWDDGKNTVTSFFNDGIQIGTEADVIVIDNSIPTVIKKQLRTDDGLGDVDNRDSEAFQMKLDWHNANIDRLVDQLGY